MVDKSMLVVLAAALLLCSQPAECAEKYSGDWLANELGLDNADAAQRAIGDLKESRAPTTQDFQTQIESDLLAQSELLYQLVGQQKNQEALDLSAKLIGSINKKLAEAKSSGEQQTLTQFLFNIYLAKVRAHYQNKQAFEALVSGLRMRSLCTKHTAYGCTGQQLHSLQSMMSYIEQVVQSTRPADALGLEPADVGNQSKMRANRRRLMAALHPDKNMDLDEESRKDLGRIFNLANKTYEQLLVQSRK